MYNFFTDINSKINNTYIITGKDYNHIANVLRMKIGERFYISCNGNTDLCVINDINEYEVKAEIVKENAINTELPISIHLFQGLPKSDKMELIIQKSVELGVSEITPVSMKRCVVKLDEKKKAAKVSRWQSISESAAKQSKRNLIPAINPVVTYNDIIKTIPDYDLFLVPYENEKGFSYTVDVINSIKPGMKIGILIGPEGGFDDNEIEKAREAGGKIISLGSRILRTETAAITAVAMCMLKSESLEK